MWMNMDYQVAKALLALIYQDELNLNLTTASIKFLYYIMTDTIATALAYAQCVPGFSNPNQKSIDFFTFILQVYIRQIRIS